MNFQQRGNGTDACVCVCFGLDSLFIQGKPLANGYYTRYPVKCTVDRNEKQNKKNFIIESMWVYVSV